VRLFLVDAVTPAHTVIRAAIQTFGSFKPPHYYSAHRFWVAKVDVLVFLLKYVGGPLLGIIVTLSFMDAIKERLAPLIARFGSKKEEGIQGEWLATFEFGRNVLICSAMRRPLKDRKPK
jgi:hypothetical protein